MNESNIRDLGIAVLETEAEAIKNLIGRVDGQFQQACELMLACTGRIVVTGMGKSGHIGDKIASTLASTGTPAFFMHPGEASHGDLGMITPTDVVLALSNSGTTEEILLILPLIKRLGVPLIALTGNVESELAREATVNIDVSVEKEACPLGLAPTASTTAALAMGDAMAIALLNARGFTEHDFARSHPGGRLGRRLLLHIEDIMRTGDHVPSVRSGVTLSEAMVEMTKKGIGVTAILDHEQRVIGIFTDGDLRRTLEKQVDIRVKIVDDVMIRDCKTAQRHLLAAEGLRIMQQHKVGALLIVDDEHRLEGAMNMHDLLRAGVA
ncbi:MAG: KpsF/GutQ family sugar-phosphate isomerase [Gammaproteobacteria bacterium]|nr:MAG: KpsF/GutQ family sugar-phosphate isomerase [Gammaproteobacteria bacterium]